MIYSKDGDNHFGAGNASASMAFSHLYPSTPSPLRELACTTKPYDAFFLCQVPSVNLDNDWNSTALKACVQAKTHWGQGQPEPLDLL